jgi:Tfp pilus assembly protein PilF
LRRPVECYFDRAIRFKPDDGIVRLVYGTYLSASGRLDEALVQLNEAVKLNPRNANANYNLGLLYLRKKDYAQAKLFAKKAYQLGFPLPGLKNQLSQAGKWDEQSGNEIPAP